jgi:hypothetical protein
VITRAVLRAHQLRSIGPGQKWLVEREYGSDGWIRQRVNEGRGDLEDEWTEVGRWTDLEDERAKLLRDGWKLDS